MTRRITPLSSSLVTDSNTQDYPPSVFLLYENIEFKETGVDGLEIRRIVK
jgi:hypothetical protein